MTLNDADRLQRHLVKRTFALSDGRRAISQVVTTPIDIIMDTPLALPKNKSYPNPAPTVECLDVEVQVRVTFSDQ